MPDPEKIGQLLAADEGHQRVDAGDPGIDIVTRIDTGYRVQRQTIDIRALLGIDLAQTVDRTAAAVEYAAQQFK